MAVGLAETDKIFYAAASGVGMPIVYLGSKTGRDGIHGATMASAEFDEDSRGEAPDRAGRRSVLREAAARSLPRDHGQGLRDRDPGHGRGRAHLLGGRDGRQGRSRRDARSRRRAVPRDRHDRLRDDALGEPGAHAHGAQAGEGEGGRGDLPQMGPRLRGRRQDHADQALHRQARRQGDGRPADQGARRRGAGLRPAACRDAEAAGDQGGRRRRRR